MIYLFLIVMLGFVVQPGPDQSGAETVLNRKVSMKLDKATVYDVVLELRAKYSVPLSYIQSNRSYGKIGDLNLNVSDRTVREVLEKIKSDSPDYTYGFTEGHLILYPKEPKYQRVVDFFSATKKSRFDLTNSYLDALRSRWPEFKQVISPPKKGNPKALLFTELVSIRPKGTVLNGFAQLLGNNQSAVFSIIYWEKSGQPVFVLDVVR